MLAYKTIRYKTKVAKGKWRPKCRWLVSMTISLDESKKTKCQYYTPKSAEEEKKLEDDFDFKMQRVFDLIFPDGIYAALKDLKESKKTAK